MGRNDLPSKGDRRTLSAVFSRFGSKLLHVC